MAPAPGNGSAEGRLLGFRPALSPSWRDNSESAARAASASSARHPFVFEFARECAAVRSPRRPAGALPRDGDIYAIRSRRHPRMDHHGSGDAAIEVGNAEFERAGGGVARAQRIGVASSGHPAGAGMSSTGSPRLAARCAVRRVSAVRPRSPCARYRSSAARRSSGRCACRAVPAGDSSLSMSSRGHLGSARRGAGQRHLDLDCSSSSHPRYRRQAASGDERAPPALAACMSKSSRRGRAGGRCACADDRGERPIADRVAGDLGGPPGRVAWRFARRVGELQVETVQSARPGERSRRC